MADIRLVGISDLWVINFVKPGFHFTRLFVNMETHRQRLLKGTRDSTLSCKPCRHRHLEQKQKMSKEKAVPGPPKKLDFP